MIVKLLPPVVAAVVACTKVGSLVEMVVERVVMLGLATVQDKRVRRVLVVPEALTLAIQTQVRTAALATVVTAEVVAVVLVAAAAAAAAGTAAAAAVAVIMVAVPVVALRGAVALLTLVGYPTAILLMV